MRSILFVDDEPELLSAVRRMLHPFRKEWTLWFASGGREALKLLASNSIDAVVTDVNMPGMDGLELLAKIASGEFGFIPVVVVTGKTERQLKRQAIELGAQDLLSKPLDHEDLIARLRSVLAIKKFQDELNLQNIHLEKLVASRTAELEASRLELVIQLSMAAELRDVDTADHVLRVAMFSRALGLHLGMSEVDSDELFLASTLHDIGKIAIPDAILQKQGSLNAFERKYMESHCAIGNRLLTERDSALLRLMPSAMHVESTPPRVLTLAGCIARRHHERWDGTGYPDGLKGEEIPLPARIVAVADALDALRSRRPYKESYDWATSRERILASSGSHFDPTICEAFVQIEPALMQLDDEMRKNEADILIEVAA